MIRYCGLADADLEAVQNMVINAIWRRPTWDEGFAGRYFTWRFVERQDDDAVFAFDGDRCVAMLDCFTREYVVDGSVLVVGEPSDWFCLPEYRGSQVGLELLLRTMKKHPRLIVVGGSEMTRQILPRLGWQTLAPVHTYLHVVHFGRTIPRVASRLGLQRSLRIASRLGLQKTLPTAGARRALAGRAQKHRQASSGFSTYDVTPMNESTDTPYPDLTSREPGIQNLVDSRDVVWLRKAPILRDGTGYRWLSFLRDGEQKGVSLSRTYDTGRGTEGKILHLQTVSEDLDLHNSIIAETTRDLIVQGASVISARFSSPLLERALRKEGYLRGGALPAFWWSKETPAPTGSVKLSGVRGDDMLLPMEP